MAEQYMNYDAIPEQVRELIANKVSLLDEYILMQTGEAAYTALIRDTTTGTVREIVCYRETNLGPYQVVELDGSWDFTVTNEFYTYSNIGYGAALELPVVEGVTAHAACILACALMFAIVFKGVLFPCLLGRKRKDF